MLKVNNKLYYTLLPLFLWVILVGGRLPYTLFYFFLLLNSVSFFSLWYSIKKLEGKLEVASVYGKVDDSIDIRYKITNYRNSKLPFLELTNIIGGSTKDPVKTSSVASLDPGETVIMDKKILCSRRGTFDIEGIRIRTGDTLGFFNIERSLSKGEKIKVYPKVKYINRLLAFSRHHYGENPVKDKLLEDTSRIYQLREWVQGDSPKRIHWKLSAKFENLIVKNYEYRGETYLNILVDMDKLRYSQDENHGLEDLAVEIAASVIFTALNDGISFTLYSQFNNTIIKGNNIKSFTNIMDSLIAFEPISSSNFSPYFRNVGSLLKKNSTIILITPEINLDDGKIILDLRQRGYSVIVFSLVKTFGVERDRQILSKLAKEGVSVNLSMVGLWGESNG